MSRQPTLEQAESVGTASFFQGATIGTDLAGLRMCVLVLMFYLCVTV